MKNITQAQAMDEAVRKARRPDSSRITADERDGIVADLRINPLPAVRHKWGRSYLTLCRIAEANGL